MHIKRFLHNLLSSTIHGKRFNTLNLFINALLREKKLSLTQLGRALKNKAQEKNNIKRCDRFLGNKNLHGERFSIYQKTAHRLIGTNSRPIILVDWSHVPNTTHYLLRASLVAKGRALSVYEEVFPRQYENSDKAHHLFLQNLKQVLPETSLPILVTDAGFYNSWFRLVLKQGWDYVGRIRGNICYRLDTHTYWEYYCDSKEKATEQGQSLGWGIVSKTDPIETFLYLIKLSAKKRTRFNKYKKKAQSKKDKVYSKSANEPWLLASSLNNTETSFNPFSIYFKRMQIEQNFRDLKSSQYGFSFEHAYSKSIERIQVLLMIAMLATLIAYLTGFVAENKRWHLSFQANTSQKKRVLSLFYLGCRIIQRKFKHRIDYDKAVEALQIEILVAGREL
ncbi:IS4 family transposase [Legionella quinlivanii]|uniref:IS4 family transposase n=1 Tax=Legionella quinlivanii TaxID=45073 RepID=UPI0022449B81|nr:IS4 family transposase [Legionella quinlivanii]MCW8449818.1 IS4 family transposase [Legionella quinlivanii]MCW8451456.1 IS4 family transposase [Legionella quinlivanii]